MKTKEKFACIYANLRDSDCLVYCKMTDEVCRLSHYGYPDNQDYVGEMPHCPTFNAPKELAKRVVQARFNMKRDDLVAKLG